MKVFRKVGVFVMAFGVWMVLCLWIGHCWGVSAMQREACKAGFADYDADENGDAQFVWAVPFGASEMNRAD